MLLNQMKYLVSIVDCNSFTEAAEQNFISQSAISQQIQVLEKDLGVKLIIRENRKFNLTPAGDYFYRHAREIINEIEAIKRETIRIGKKDENRLKVGYLNYYSGEDMHHAVAAFSHEHPEITIEIVSGTHEELRELLKFGDIDLMLSTQRRAFSDFFVNYELAKYNWHIELSVRNKLSHSEGVSIDALKRIPCILISSKEQQSAEQDYFENTFGFGGNFIFAESMEEARLMVAGNRGYMPIEIVGTIPPESPTIKRVHLSHGDSIVQRNFCAFWPKDRTNSYIEKFAEILHMMLNQG
jgi:DNA-binding transcriptional LysR family regulator